MNPPDDLTDRIEAVAVLADEYRRRMFEYIRSERGPVTREQAAAHVGISRKLAAFHLDKLVDAGLLEAGTRPGVRQVGRAPKAYTASRVELSVRIPARHHDLLASLLVTAITEPAANETPRDAVLRVARRHGATVGADRRRTIRAGRIGLERALAYLETMLRGSGYEPARPTPSCIQLRSCPFHPVAAQAPELVCGLNHAYIAGLVDGLGAADSIDVVLEPQADECCVTVRATG